MAFQMSPRQLFFMLISVMTGIMFVCLVYLQNAHRYRWKINPAMYMKRSHDIDQLSTQRYSELYPYDDTKKLIDVLEKWPVNKPKAVIYTMTRPVRLQSLLATLAQLDMYFNDQFHYPIVIFHSDNYTDLIKPIRNGSRSDLFFIPIEFRLPDFLPPPDDWPETQCPKREGYKHMCRFHCKTFFELPWVRQLEYYWRFDDDSRIHAPITYNVFTYMRTNDFLYGYFLITGDAAKCTVGLLDLAKQYMKLHGIKSDLFDKWRWMSAYYNNFEISKMSIWITPQYKNFIEFIDRAGGIFYHRWGDAPIKSLAITMFVKENKIHQFSDFHYQHRKIGFAPEKE